MKIAHTRMCKIKREERKTSLSANALLIIKSKYVMRVLRRKVTKNNLVQLKVKQMKTQFIHLIVRERDLLLVIVAKFQTTVRLLQAKVLTACLRYLKWLELYATRKCLYLLLKVWRVLLSLILFSWDKEKGKLDHLVKDCNLNLSLPIWMNIKIKPKFNSVFYSKQDINL